MHCKLWSAQCCTCRPLIGLQPIAKSALAESQQLLRICSISCIRFVGTLMLVKRSLGSLVLTSRFVFRSTFITVAAGDEFSEKSHCSAKNSSVQCTPYSDVPLLFGLEHLAPPTREGNTRCASQTCRGLATPRPSPPHTHPTKTVERRGRGVSATEDRSGAGR